MKKIVRKIIIRYDSVNKDEEFTINSNTSLMRVPKVGEVMNISKLQYKVDKVVTNLNISNPLRHKSVNIDEFDGISYYIKLVRFVNTKGKQDDKQNPTITNEDIIKAINSIKESIGDINNTTDNNNNNDFVKDIENIKKNIESIRSTLSITLTEDHLKELKDFINNIDFNISIESENGYTMDDIKENFESLTNKLEELKENINNVNVEPKKEISIIKPSSAVILNITREYRIRTTQGKGYSSKFTVIGRINGIKVKTKQVKEHNTYTNSQGVMNYLDEYNYNEDTDIYEGVEFNDILIKLKSLEIHLREDKILEKDDTLTVDSIVDTFTISDMVKFSIKYPDSVSIVNGLTNDTSTNNILLNYCIRNK